MKVEQNIWKNGASLQSDAGETLNTSAQLALVFGAKPIVEDRFFYQKMRNFYPNAHILGCSTAGEIQGTQIYEDAVVATAITFESTRVEGARIALKEVESAFQAGTRLSHALAKDGLVHLFVLSDGLNINGSDLVRGLTCHLPKDVTVTGGLAGDGDRFKETLVCYDGYPESGTVAAIGLYGSNLQVGCSSRGGWDPFGPERLITRSQGNILYELDGRSALELYKKYLGEHAKRLPGAGIFFPLSLRTPGSGETGVVRTVLSINEEDQSMIFPGDVPEGAYARFMKANFDRLIDGSIGAAKTCYGAVGSAPPDLAVLISCFGRKMILKQRTEEEVEGVRDVFGDRTILTGFYSYGEISPFTSNGSCELHNQTMTITTFTERGS